MPSPVLTRLLARLQLTGFVTAGQVTNQDQWQTVLEVVTRTREVLRPRDFRRLERELQDSRSAPIQTLWRQVLTQTKGKQPRVSFLPRMELYRFGQRFVTSNGQIDPFFPADRLPEWNSTEDLLRLIFDHPAFDEYLHRLRLLPSQIRKLMLEYKGDHGGSKTVCRLTIEAFGRSPIHLAMRIFPIRLHEASPETLMESKIIREVLQSPASHLIPRHQGSFMVKRYETSPLSYLIFFAEWIEAPTLVEVLGGLSREHRRMLSKKVFEAYVRGSEHSFFFPLLDLYSGNIKVLGWETIKPRFIFLDFGMTSTDPYDHIFSAYKTFVVRGGLEPEEVVPFLYRIPVFRGAFDTRLEFYRKGRLHELHRGPWSETHDRIELSMLQTLEPSVTFR